MLVDNITLTIKAGDGGNGAATFLSFGRKGKGGPDGGSGGNGGNIYFQGSNNTNCIIFSINIKMFFNHKNYLL